MSPNKVSSNDFKSLASSNKKKSAGEDDISTLKPLQKIKQESGEEKETDNPLTLINPSSQRRKIETDQDLQPRPVQTEQTSAEIINSEKKVEAFSLSFAEEDKQRKLQKAAEKDQKLLGQDRWIIRNGHNLTYVGLFLFTLVLYFRPYEWIPGFQSLTSLALIFAISTLLIYLPTQVSTEGNITILTTEVKCLLFLVGWGLLTMPLAKDPGTAWQVFDETLSKIVIMFVVMVNTLRTGKRLKGLMWLSIGMGVFLSYQAIDLYRQGKFEVEGYRVNVDYGGMFGNPNDMALHLVMFIPLAVVLGIISKNIISKLIYFVSAGLMIGATMVTQSRGGFLGLVAIFGFLVWKLSKKARLKVILGSIIVAGIVVAVAPGDYGKRIISIFDVSQDASGSHDQRRELLERSIQVTLRNPLGIGLGNFPIVGVRNLQTHNAFTQISSELGWLGLIAYCIFLISPVRKLAAIERQLLARGETNWIYYLSIGLQTCLISYMVSSFFVSVAYQWFVYYPIAYAVCLRRIYNIQQHEKGEEGIEENSLSDYLKLQKS
jgi:putative inorganic carbon (hco3(-)) transporter